MSAIYVSSTFADLHQHRKTVSLAIRRLGHVDVAMEYYVAEDARPLDRCLRDARSCDLYMGLFARRYGFCPGGYDRSITELEFRAAKESHVESLCFLLAEDAAWPDEYVEHGAGANKLSALRAELCDRFLSGFFSTPDELAAIASAAIVRNLELGRTPFDAMREHRLMKSWRFSTSPIERVRAGQALVNMGSPRYVAAIKERLLAAEVQQDVPSIAYYLEELQRLAASRQELMPIFLDLLEHEDWQKRFFAVFQLGELALRGVEFAPRILEVVLARSGDSSVAIREQLAHTLGKLTSNNRSRPDVTKTLERLLRDSDPGVREEAERSSRS
jgi:Domain of unknown function (DUF4062)/HEAT repeats